MTCTTTSTPARRIAACACVLLTLGITIPARAQVPATSGGDEFYVNSITQLGPDTYDVKLKNPRTGYVHSVTIYIDVLAIVVGDLVEQVMERGRVKLRVVDRPGSQGGGGEGASSPDDRGRGSPPPPPGPPQACRAQTPQELYFSGFQEGFVGCVVSTLTSPLALLNVIVADAGDQAQAVGAMLRGDAATAADILRIKGDRNRRQLEAMVRSLNPDILNADALERGRIDGSRICQFWVLPQVAGSVIPKTKPPTPPEPVPEPPLLEQDYLAALRLQFPSQYANAFARIVDEIARAAAAKVAGDPRFLQALQAGDITTAGTLFHAAARAAANAWRTRLPEGWKMFAEQQTIDPKGDVVKPDLYFRGPCGELVIFDWKTSGRSALAAIKQMDNYMGTLQWQTRLQGYAAPKVITAQSVSWIDYVRPMVPRGLLANYRWR